MINTDEPTVTGPTSPATSDFGSTTKDDAASSPCVDDASFPCVAWAKSGECQRIPVFMHSTCALSCGCNGQAAAPGSTLPKPTTPITARAPATSAAPAVPAENDNCKSWCGEHTASLEVKCTTFVPCNACAECKTLKAPATIDVPTEFTAPALADVTEPQHSPAPTAVSSPTTPIADTTKEASDKAVADKAASDKAAADKAASDKAVSDKAAADKAASDKAAADKAAADKAAADKAAADKAAADEAAADKAAADKAASDKAAADKAAADKAAADKAASDKAAADKAAADKAAADKAASDKAAADKAAADKAAADKAAADEAAAELNAPTPINLPISTFPAVPTVPTAPTVPDSEIDVWLIGDMQREARGNVSLLQRLNTALLPVSPKQTINVMGIDEATAMLEADGISPLWKWPQFGSLGADQDQDHQPPTMLHPEPWDYDNMHHDPFNLLRFYLPYLGPFRELGTLFLCDDDIVVQKPIATLEFPMGDGPVIAATCNGWLWADGCMRNEPYYNGRGWLDYPVTYLGKDKAHAYSGCTEEAMENGNRICQQDEFASTVMRWSERFNGKELLAAAQPRWNFGMSRINLTEWRAQKMTEVFDSYMHANYESSLIPETSLAFGLGIPYFAFADKVKCWNDFVGDPAFVDGLGYISKADLKLNKLDPAVVLGEATVLHWSGRNKPFDPLSEMDPEIYKPFDDVREYLEHENGLEPFIRQTPDTSKESIRALLYADPFAGAEWFYELLDETPDVCASGATGNPTVAFAGESFIPPHFEAVQDSIPICAQKRACLWSFVAQNVPRYVKQRNIWCTSSKYAFSAEGNEAEENEIHDTHGDTLCKWADRLVTMFPDRTDYTDLSGIQALWNLYEKNVFSMASDLVPCAQACGFKPVRMLKFMRTWAQPMMNGSEPVYTWRDNVDGGPKYFEGSFSGEHCDGAALPAGGCTGSEPFLPRISWDTYKIVELTRWNLLDRCLAETSFAKGITEDPNVRIEPDSSSTAGNVNLDDLLSCIKYAGAQRDADSLRSDVFSGERIADWMTLHYEICSMPSHIQECVDAVVDHVVDTESPFLGISQREHVEFKSVDSPGVSTATSADFPSQGKATTATSEGKATTATSEGEAATAISEGKATTATSEG
ncbi:hypothetical protein Ctob_001226 [Chrysochromulina tobinii]|uniref:ShKT domain-containing protein n=1 Tax=Chrysochromulina tobinii TaxID=1460289 RepID=A0A0M0JML8_9EUKA|nr:hypothetical protein Ctob_001226 [Chrysochromulina tobinii]|eukprot:KOO27826.1 hypothetical protein Ctob_001226 [Chrysochromulina sp. CCMP291]